MSASRSHKATGGGDDESFHWLASEEEIAVARTNSFAKSPGSPVPNSKQPQTTATPAAAASTVKNHAATSAAPPAPPHSSSPRPATVSAFTDHSKIPPPPPPLPPSREAVEIAVSSLLERGDWLRVVDPGTSRAYYFQPSTREVTWNLHAIVESDLAAVLAQRQSVGIGRLNSAPRRDDQSPRGAPAADRTASPVPGPVLKSTSKKPEVAPPAAASTPSPKPATSVASKSRLLLAKSPPATHRSDGNATTGTPKSLSSTISTTPQSARPRSTTPKWSAALSTRSVALTGAFGEAPPLRRSASDAHAGVAKVKKALLQASPAPGGAGTTTLQRTSTAPTGTMSSPQVAAERRVASPRQPRAAETAAASSAKIVGKPNAEPPVADLRSATATSDDAKSGAGGDEKALRRAAPPPPSLDALVTPPQQQRAPRASASPRDHSISPAPVQPVPYSPYSDTSAHNAPAPTPKQIAFRERVTALYREHNPSKLLVVDELLQRYEGREEELWRTLVSKYTPEEDHAAVSAGAMNSARGTPRRATFERDVGVLPLTLGLAYNRGGDLSARTTPRSTHGTTPRVARPAPSGNATPRTPQTTALQAPNGGHRAISPLQDAPSPPALTASPLAATKEVAGLATSSTVHHSGALQSHVKQFPGVDTSATPPHAHATPGGERPAAVGAAALLAAKDAAEAKARAILQAARRETGAPPLVIVPDLAREALELPVSSPSHPSHRSAPGAAFAGKHRRVSLSPNAVKRAPTTGGSAPVATVPVHAHHHAATAPLVIAHDVQPQPPPPPLAHREPGEFHHAPGGASEPHDAVVGVSPPRGASPATSASRPAPRPMTFQSKSPRTEAPSAVVDRVAYTDAWQQELEKRDTEIALRRAAIAQMRQASMDKRAMEAARRADQQARIRAEERRVKEDHQEQRAAQQQAQRAAVAERSPSSTAGGYGGYSADPPAPPPMGKRRLL